MDKQYWDGKFNLLAPMYHNNEVNGGEDKDDIILHLQQIAVDQVKRDIAILEYAKQKDPACIHGFVRAIAAIRAGAPDEKS